jgi:hypothetical protein
VKDNNGYAHAFNASLACGCVARSEAHERGVIDCSGVGVDVDVGDDVVGVGFTVVDAVGLAVCDTYVVGDTSVVGDRAVESNALDGCAVFLINVDVAVASASCKCRRSKRPVLDSALNTVITIADVIITIIIISILVAFVIVFVVAVAWTVSLASFRRHECWWLGISSLYKNCSRRLPWRWPWLSPKFLHV